VILFVVFTGSNYLLKCEQEFHQNLRENELKRTLVRYTFHQIRTPLNIIFIGIQFLSEKLTFSKKNNLVRVEDRSYQMDCKDVLVNMKTGCDDALGVLNNMLAYDKLESNLVSLCKGFAYPKRIIDEALSPFFLQVVPMKY
jgi:signal transduction histidine kinase